jgi:hydrogenase maturation protease
MVSAPPPSSPVVGREMVVGYGSELRSDDGVGWAVVRRLVADPRFAGVDVRGEPQLAPELAIDASRASLVVLVDAAADLEPGAIRIRTLAGDGRPASAWTHHIEPDDLIALTRELWGSAPPVVTVSVGVASLEVGESLTLPVEAAVPRVVDAVAEVIAGHRSSGVSSTPAERDLARPAEGHGRDA